MPSNAVTVLHLITTLDVGGAESMLLKLATRSDSARFRHVVVGMTDLGATGRAMQAQGVPVRVLGMRRSRPTVGGIARLLDILRRESPDIVQTWLYHADLLGLLAARWAGVGCVAWNIRSSNDDLGRYPRLTRSVVRLNARLSRLPSAVVVNSEAGRALHTSMGYRPRRWAVIGNGFDTRQFAPDALARREIRAELALDEEAVLIGLIARFDPLKGYATFLRAAGHLTRTGASAHFVLAGEGATHDNPVLESATRQEHIADRIHLLECRSDIPRLMAALDMATSSSLTEGFPNTVGEAMACGVPCVVTDVGDSARIVGQTGIVVPPQDPAALAEGWRRLIELGPDGRRELGRAARERVRQHFSLERVVGEYEALYAQLMNSRARR